MIRPWPLLQTTPAISTRIFRLLKQQSVSPRTGQPHEFFVLEAPDWINVIPLIDDDQVVMIRQYRHGRKEVTLEIPGGMVDPEDASPAAAARRELREETGYEAKRIESLGAIAPNPAIQNNLCHSFLARDLNYRGKQHLEGTEDIEIQLVPLAEVPALIQQGQITHALVVVAFTFYFSQHGVFGRSGL